MKAFIAALGLWTAAVLSVLFYNPFEVAFAGATCGRTVGRSDACQAAIYAANELIGRYSHYPMLAFMLAGYVAIVVVAIRGRRKRARQQAAGTNAGS